MHAVCEAIINISKEKEKNIGTYLKQEINSTKTNKKKTRFYTNNILN